MSRECWCIRRDAGYPVATRIYSRSSWPIHHCPTPRQLGVPIGSIGPTRARCFARLRRELAALGVNSGCGTGNDRRGRRRDRPMR